MRKAKLLNNVYEFRQLHTIDILAYITHCLCSKLFTTDMRNHSKPIHAQATAQRQRMKQATQYNLVCATAQLHPNLSHVRMSPDGISYQHHRVNNILELQGIAKFGGR